MSNQYLDTRSAARFLSVSEDTLRAWRSRKKGPAYTKVEGAVRYSINDLEEYLSAHRVQHAS